MKVVPTYIEENSPPGEKVLFANFESAEKDWTVLHSLDLAPFNRNRRTEIDFVIIAPDLGILCIEVKSQKSIYFDGEHWQPHSIKGSPFKQALDGRFAFYRRLKAHFGKRFEKIPVLHCCIFPESDFSIQANLNIRDFEVLDRQDVLKAKDANSLCNKIQQNMLLAIHQDPSVHALVKPLTQDDVNDIVEFCYPIRKRKPSLVEEIKLKQKELEAKLQVQQKPVLALTNLNPCVLVEGGAGTGKSLIAMEIARIKALQGKRVAYLCFNRLIGKYSKIELEKAGLPNLIAGGIHSVLLTMCDITVPPEHDQQWWEETLIELIEEKLTDPDFSSNLFFDYLVLDEAQDVLARPALWNCLQSFLSTSPEKAEYLILGDFVNQTLTIDSANLTSNLSRLQKSSTRWVLDENCRNYKAIGETALLLSGSDQKTWSGYKRKGGNLENWDLQQYDNDTEQAELVLECIHRARNSGFKDKEITILTFCSIEKSIVKSLVRSNLMMTKADDFDSDYISYSTIDGYKGMENKVIIISNVVLSPQNRERERKVFYTGMTRATEKLFVLCKKSTASILAEWIAQGMK